MKKLLIVIIGIILLCFMIAENHSYTEQQKFSYKHHVLVSLSIAQKQSSKYNWTSEQEDSCYQAVLRSTGMKEPGLCVYCKIIEPIIK